MSYIMGFDPSETTTDQEFALGTIAQDYNGEWYQYVQADATAGAEVVDGLTTTAAESSNAAAAILLWPKVGRTL